MKSSLLLIACLSGCALSTNIAQRAIDPITIDPTRLSVLSVLHTAVPSGFEAIPTGDVLPAWYQQLPEDVKSLLPKLYPGGAQEVSSAVASIVASSTSPGPASTPSAPVYSAMLPSATSSASHIGVHSPNGTAVGVASPTGGLGFNTSVPHGNRTQSAFVPVQTISRGAKNGLGIEVVAGIALGVMAMGFSLLA